MSELDIQKRKRALLDGFPGGLLILIAAVLVFALNLMSGTRVIGVDYEKVALKKEWLTLNKEKEEFYKNKKEADDLAVLIGTRKADLGKLQQDIDQRKKEKSDATLELNQLIEQITKNKQDEAVVAAELKGINQQKASLLSSKEDLQKETDAFQSKVSSLKAESEGLRVKSEQLLAQNSELEARQESLKKKISDSEGQLRNSIKDLASTVDVLKTENSSFGNALDGLGQNAKGLGGVAGNIQDSATKLSQLSKEISAQHQAVNEASDQLKAVLNTVGKEDKQKLDSNKQLFEAVAGLQAALKRVEDKVGALEKNNQQPAK